MMNPEEFLNFNAGIAQAFIVTLFLGTLTVYLVHKMVRENKAQKKKN